MSDETMPVAEAATTDERELVSYELAFHVLPTVAEGEVPAAFDAIKAHITKNNGEIFDEEAPERFDLAYDIVKHMEGKNRKYSSAYFGWIRFKSESSAIEEIIEEVEADSNVLRHILIKLTKVEEEHPFKFHEALAEEKKVTTVEESSVVPDVTTVSAEEGGEAKETELKTEDEESAEVDESELDAALKKEEAE